MSAMRCNSARVSHIDERAGVRAAGELPRADHECTGALGIDALGQSSSTPRRVAATCSHCRVPPKTVALGGDVYAGLVSGPYSTLG